MSYNKQTAARIRRNNIVPDSLCFDQLEIGENYFELFQGGEIHLTSKEEVCGLKRIVGWYWFPNSNYAWRVRYENTSGVYPFAKKLSEKNRSLRKKSHPKKLLICPKKKIGVR